MGNSVDAARTVSRGHRYAMWFFTFLLTVLFIWCGQFVLRDIDSIPRPNLAELERAAVGDTLFDEKKGLETAVKELDRAIAAKEERRASLKDSTDESRTTMNQLMEIQKERIERTDEEKAYFAESQRIFLANQKQLQAIITELQDLRSEKRDKQYALGKVNDTISEKKKSAQDDYNDAKKRWNRKTLALKLVFIVPLVVLGAWLFTKKRSPKVSNIIYAFDIAAMWLLIQVIHHHFAFKYAKYIFVLSAIVVVIVILLYLVRAMLKPSMKRLLRKYEEAYRDNRCPVCGFPIQQGKVTYLLPGKRFLRKTVPVPVYEQAEPQPYTCPLCGTDVFAKCGQCGRIRHSLLEYCAHCGDRRDMSAAKASEGGDGIKPRV